MDNKTNTDDYFESIKANAKAAGSDFYEGKIRSLTYMAGGEIIVLFEEDNGGAYSSVWESWTHNAVKMAIKYNKKVIVIANGQPVLNNITSVTVRSDTV